MNETAWIIGASTGLGRQLAEILAQQGISVILSSRNHRDLESLVNHIKTKYQVIASAFLLDLETITDVSKSADCIDQLLHHNSFPSRCYFLAGAINENDESIKSAGYLNLLLQQNFTGPVFLINEIISRKQKDPLLIVAASSIAAARARGKNIAYASAKRALEFFCSGLMHALSTTNVTIQIYRFGYLDTNLSYGQQLPFPAASPGFIARKVIAAGQKGPGLYYLPRFWWFISFVLNLIPFGIYKKLKF